MYQRNVRAANARELEQLRVDEERRRRVEDVRHGRELLLGARRGEVDVLGRDAGVDLFVGRLDLVAEAALGFHLQRRGAGAARGCV